MNSAWLLKSSTLWTALGVSTVSSLAILFLSPDGIVDLRNRQAELRGFKEDLTQKARQNRELAEEVRRLAARDPELLEALARRQGFARPGETIYTFRERGEHP
jgi:cell division protein FtsB